MTSEISTIEAMLAVGIALSVDAFQALLDFFGIGIFLNWMITFFIEGMFGWWFFSKGVKLLSKKSLLSFFLPAGIEFIPLVDMLPAITIGVISTIGVSWAEGYAKMATGQSES